MGLNHDLVGQRFGPARVSWHRKDAILYALGIGAGGEDPREELELTTENSHGVRQTVFPTFPLVLEPSLGIPLGDYDPAMLVHGEQSLEVYRPLPLCGAANVERAVTGIHDKGSGALVATESTAVAEGSGETLWRSWSTLFIRGEGGFGGRRGSSGPSWERPDREPDAVACYRTHPEQALVYRLSGDRNPLHSDPIFAARAGFQRPILHGLCTYGISARLAVRLLGARSEELLAVDGRFTNPVTPGDTVQVNLWRTGASEALFQTRRDDGTIVLDRGRIELADRPVEEQPEPE